MKKLIRWSIMAVMLAALFYCGSLMADKAQLQNNLIRLHVVANSDTSEDQAQKLLVRDAIVAAVGRDLDNAMDMEQAKAYLREKLPELEALANRVLQEAGSEAKAKLTLAKEAFGVRIYETFSLPSGVYESLRVTIGNGEGKNWWCVVFPSLCLPAAAQDFHDTAVSSGLSEQLTGTLSGQGGYEIRFFLLDCWGRLENLFFSK